MQPAQPQGDERVEVRVWDRADALDRLEPAWRRLWHTTRPRPPMLEFDWVRQWWRSYGAVGKLFVIERVHQGASLGIAPLYVRRCMASAQGLLRSVCFLSTGEPEAQEVFGTHLGWLGKPSETAATTQAVAAALAQNRGRWDRLWLRNIGPDTGWVRDLLRLLEPQLQDVEVSRTRNYRARVRDLTRYVDQFQPGRHRRELRRVLRVGEAAGVQLVRARGLAQAKRMFEVLVQLHRRQWQRRAGPDACEHPRFLEFHRRMLPHYAREDRLWVVGIRDRERWLAVHYDIQAGDGLYAYLAGIDPEHGRALAAGKLMLLLLIQEACRSGLGRLELFGGNDEYKHRLADETFDTVSLDALGRGPVPRLYRDLRRVKRRLSNVRADAP